MDAGLRIVIHFTLQLNICPFKAVTFLTETVTKTNLLLLCGEVTSNAKVDYDRIVRDTIKEIGFDDTEKGLDSISLIRLAHISLKGKKKEQRWRRFVRLIWFH